MDWLIGVRGFLVTVLFCGVRGTGNVDLFCGRFTLHRYYIIIIRLEEKSMILSNRTKGFQGCNLPGDERAIGYYAIIFVWVISWILIPVSKLTKIR